MSTGGAAKKAQPSSTRALSREQLMVALEAAHVGAWEWNCVTGEMLWSAEHERLFGLPAGSFPGDSGSFLERLHPDDRPRVQEAAWRAVETRGLYEAEYRVPHPGGGWRWIAARGRCIEEAAGRPLRFAGAVWDVTERKQAEEASREEAERARLLLRATNDAVWDWDLRTDQLTWNEATPQVLRYRAEEIRSDLAWWEERVHPDDRPRCVDSLWAVIRGGGSVWREHYRFLRGDGRYMHVVDRGYVQRDPDGLPVRMLGSMLDVSEQHEREADLGKLLAEARTMHLQAERARAALDAIIEQFPAAVALLRAPDLVFERLNGAARSSWTTTNPVGRPLREVFAGTSADTLLAAFDEVLRSGRPWQGREVHVAWTDPEGRRQERFLDFALQPLFDADGHLAQVLCLRLDVTAQVQARQGAEELARRLDAQRAWFEAVLDNLPMPLVMLEPDAARLTFANKAAARVSATRLLRSSDPRASRAGLSPLAFVEAAQGEPLSGMEVAWRGPGGEERILALYSTRMAAMHGQPATVVLPFLDVTELKEVQRQLEQTVRERNESLALLDAILAAAPAGFAYYDRELRYRRVNVALAQLNGRPVAEHLGRTMHEVLPSGAEILERILRRVLETGEPQLNLDLSFSQLPTPPPTPQHFLASAYPVRVGDEVVGVGVLVIDITERRESEQQLALAAARERALREQAEAARGEAIESQRRYQTIGDAIPFGIFVSDAKGRPEYISPGLLELAGVSLERAREVGWEPFVPAAQLEDERRRWRESARSGALFEAERALLGASGEEHWVLTRGRAVRGADGHISSWVGINLDITDRKRLEQSARFLSDASTALASSLDLQEMLAAAARLVVPALADWCAIYLLGESGGCELACVRHPDEALTARARGALGQLPVTERATGRVPDFLAQGRTEALLDAGRLDERLLFDPAQRQLLGELGDRSLIYVPFLSQGRPVGSLLLGRAPGRRPFEPHHVPLFEELGRRLGVAVENAQLYEAAQRANRAKDEFLATLSHELRTPMTPLLAWVHLLKTRPNDPARVARALEVIERSAKAQAQLVEDLLDVSRIISGKLKLEMDRVDVREQVLAALETTRPAAEVKAVEVAFECALDLEPVLGDSYRLRQVVWNLVSNAVKFSRDGGRVGVRLFRDEGALVLEVEDAGEGIAPNFLPYVFDRFRQADPTSTRVHGGLGLGLAIVKHIVEGHGGRVRAESAGPGQGATFIVRLPLPGAPSERVAAAPAAAGVRRSGGLLDGVRLLVVDDAEDSRVVLAEILRDEGAEVLEAASAEEALALARTRPLDLVLSDIGMPGGDGHELMRALRRSPSAALRTVPAIALSGYASPQDRAKAEEAGFQKHLPKPVDVEVLLATIRQLVRR